ncbi:MAG: 30S ribosomal protein S20 [Clostridiales bacterium]|nr:30S ribosomal protein S20 [Clostridiales bacterium]
MPNTKSAKKRVKIIKKKTLRNKKIKSELKTTVKQLLTNINEESEEAINFYRKTIKKIDQAVSKGIIHKNNASRKKSKLTLKLNSLLKKLETV